MIPVWFVYFTLDSGDVIQQRAHGPCTLTDVVNELAEGLAHFLANNPGVSVTSVLVKQE